MGRQANLCDMLGAPEQLECPQCGAIIDTMFDDYDIDSPCNPTPGVWELDVGCPNCGHEWSVMYEVFPCEYVEDDGERG